MYERNKTKYKKSNSRKKRSLLRITDIDYYEPIFTLARKWGIRDRDMVARTMREILSTTSRLKQRGL